MPRLTETPLRIGKTMTAKKSKSIDVDQFLDTISTTRTAKKSKVPDVTGQEDVVDELVDLYHEKANAEAVFRAKEETLLKEAFDSYQEAIKQQRFTNSFNFVGKRHNGMLVSFKDAFSALPKESEQHLKSTLGDNFSSFFEKKREITLLDTSDETVSLLLEKLGPDTFKRIFKTEIKIKPRPEMDRKQFELPEEVRSLLKQQKGACRPRGGSEE